MFKSSRIKIILSIMGSLLVLFALTLGLILFASYRDIRNGNSDKLERYSDLFRLDSQNDQQAPPEPRPEPEVHRNSLSTTRFHRKISWRLDFCYRRNIIFLFFYWY